MFTARVRNGYCPRQIDPTAFTTVSSTSFLPIAPYGQPWFFAGLRKMFLLDQLPVYEKAVREGWANDFVADVLRRYFKHFPIDLDHSTEPTPEWLAQVDDKAADPDVLLSEELVELLKFRREVY